MNEYITPEMIQIIFTAVIIPILVILTKQLVDFIKLKGEYIRKQIKDDYLAKYYALAEIAITTAVDSVSQTFVSSLKKEEKFDEAAAKRALSMARNQALMSMNEATKNVLKELYGDVDEWVNNRIEAKVKTQK